MDPLYHVCYGYGLLPRLITFTVPTAAVTLRLLLLFTVTFVWVPICGWLVGLPRIALVSLICPVVVGVVAVG